MSFTHHARAAAHAATGERMQPVDYFHSVRSARQEHGAAALLHLRRSAALARSSDEDVAGAETTTLGAAVAGAACS